NVQNVNSSKKAKIVESKNANHLEPNNAWGSNATDIPSSSSLVMTGCPNCSLVFGLWMFKSYDMEPLSAHELSSKTKSWLWHRRLSHLNFSTLNKLAKDGLVQGIPRLKFQKDHLCSACALGKSNKSSHQPKAEDTNHVKLYLWHMNLCGPMRMASINGKRYILEIVDDYSQFTWVIFLRTKDEAPEAIIKCIKNIQVCLNANVDNVRTDNGNEFVNQTLREFYENAGISHQTSISRTPQQNGIVERQNRTLVEAARTISGIVSNLVSQQPCIPPQKDDWDHLFQPMFDEYFNPLTIVVSPVLEAAAPRAVILVDSPVSTSIDQDAPSASIPSTQEQEHSLNISQEQHDKDSRDMIVLIGGQGKWRVKMKILSSLTKIAQLAQHSFCIRV
nr:retrovirus-related Pol polyprotein from transposon TNT 1-94 [Tanacetum cinerariifolium]